MKKRINILILAGLLFSAVACDDSENNFSESTSTRIEQTLERYKFALQAGKTWVMEYFPDENLGYGALSSKPIRCARNRNIGSNSRPVPC